MYSPTLGGLGGGYGFLEADAVDPFHLATVETEELVEELNKRHEWAVVLVEPYESPEAESSLEFIFPGENAAALYRSIGMLEAAKGFAARMLYQRFGGDSG